MLDPILLAERYAAVRERLAAAAARAGRAAEDVTLVAVTKTWPAELALAAHAAGMRHFGENRAEELAEKRPAVEAALGGLGGLTWHLIGTLQSRKTHLAASHADVFHALDRVKIARRLAADLTERGRVLPAFLEVNLSGEASKSGLDMTRWEEDATQRENLRRMIAEIDYAHLPVIGLMTMAPWDAEPDVIRSVFRRARQLALWLDRTRLEQPALALSMGMTDDFDIAIEEGATHVRVGRALFGERGQVPGR
ncbi:YggS family pyridoxal phosphate-dependent enzyme [Promineifilum sp.]|uniref:YggS family pyridoxal phosphate-dependent enzyme n=1 Tax=Promineifilum sp. TaxID=2664178 RepID=UPI0035B32CE2